MPADVVLEDTLEDLMSPLKLYSNVKHGRQHSKRLASDRMLENTILDKLNSPKLVEDNKQYKHLKLKSTQKQNNETLQEPKAKLSKVSKNYSKRRVIEAEPTNTKQIKKNASSRRMESYPSENQ